MIRNMEIRNAAKSAGVKLWQIAELYGVCDTTFSRKLRHELQPEEKAKIRQIIKELSA